MRVLAVIFGILLLLPGLCFLGFGAIFTINNAWQFGLLELAIGGLITWGAALLIINYSKPK